MFDNLDKEIEVPCLACGKTFKVSVKDIMENKTLSTPCCGSTVDVEKIKQEMGGAESAINRFKGGFKL